jgi:hypothetical protein
VFWDVGEPREPATSQETTLNRQQGAKLAITQSINRQTSWCGTIGPSEIGFDASMLRHVSRSIESSCSRSNGRLRGLTRARPTTIGPMQRHGPTHSNKVPEHHIELDSSLTVAFGPYRPVRRHCSACSLSPLLTRLKTNRRTMNNDIVWSDTPS